MNRKVVAGITIGFLVACLSGYLVFKKSHSQAPVTATIRITVAPPEQLAFVADKASSPFFKYLMFKKTGIKPALAQQLVIKRVPGSGLLEGTIGVMTSDEGRRYAEGFVETLQDVCGKQAQIALVVNSVR